MVVAQRNINDFETQLFKQCHYLRLIEPDVLLVSMAQQAPIPVSSRVKHSIFAKDRCVASPYLQHLNIHIIESRDALGYTTLQVAINRACRFRKAGEAGIELWHPHIYGISETTLGLRH